MLPWVLRSDVCMDPHSPASLPPPRCTQAGVRDKAKEVSLELCAYLGQVRAWTAEGVASERHLRAGPIAGPDAVPAQHLL